jgi:hypothetical protein
MSLKTGFVTMLVIETENWLKKKYDVEDLAEEHGIDSFDELERWFNQCLIRTSLVSDMSIYSNAGEQTFIIKSDKYSGNGYETAASLAQVATLTGIYQLIIPFSNRDDVGIYGGYSGYTGDALTDIHIDTVATYAYVRAMHGWFKKNDLNMEDVEGLLEVTEETLKYTKERLEQDLNVLGSDFEE